MMHHRFTQSRAGSKGPDTSRSTASYFSSKIVSKAKSLVKKLGLGRKKHKKSPATQQPQAACVGAHTVYNTGPVDDAVQDLPHGSVEPASNGHIVQDLPQSGAVQTQSAEATAPAQETADIPQAETHSTFPLPTYLRHAQSGRTLRQKRSMSHANYSRVKKSLSFADARAVVKKKSSRLIKGLGAVFGSNHRSSHNSTSTSDSPSDGPASTARAVVPPLRLSSSQEVRSAQQSVAYLPNHHRRTSTGLRFPLNARSSSLAPRCTYATTGRTPYQAPPSALSLRSRLSNLSRQYSHSLSGTTHRLDQRTNPLPSAQASPLSPLFSHASAEVAPSRSLLSAPMDGSQRSGPSRQSSQFWVDSAPSLAGPVEHRVSAKLALARLLLTAPGRDNERALSSRPSSRFSIDSGTGQIGLPRPSLVPPESTLLEVEWAGTLAPGVECPPAQGINVSNWLHSTALEYLPMAAPPSAPSSTSRYGTPLGGGSPPSVSPPPGAPLARRPQPSSEYSCTTDLQPLPRGQSALRAPSDQEATLPSPSLEEFPGRLAGLMAVCHEVAGQSPHAAPRIRVVTEDDSSFYDDSSFRDESDAGGWYVEWSEGEEGAEEEGEREVEEDGEGEEEDEEEEGEDLNWVSQGRRRRATPFPDVPTMKARRRARLLSSEESGAGPARSPGEGSSYSSSPSFLGVAPSPPHVSLGSPAPGRSQAEADAAALVAAAAAPAGSWTPPNDDDDDKSQGGPWDMPLCTFAEILDGGEPSGSIPDEDADLRVALPAVGVAPTRLVCPQPRSGRGVSLALSMVSSYY